MMVEIKDRGWIAKILGEHAVYKLERKFLKPIEFKGNKKIYNVDDGIYEIKDGERYYALIEQGELRELEKDEVEELLGIEIKGPGKFIDVRVYENMIKGQTEKSYIVGMPSTGDYGGYAVFMPIKLTDYHGWFVDFSINANWEFILYPPKNSQKKEIAVSGGDLFELLHQVIDTSGRKEIEIIEVRHVPEIKEAIEIEAEDELIR